MIHIEEPQMFEVPEGRRPPHEFKQSAPGWTPERLELLRICPARGWLLRDVMILTHEVDMRRAYDDLLALACIKERQGEGGIEFAITAAGKRELARVAPIIERKED